MRSTHTNGSRLDAVHRLDILDTPPEEALDRITDLVQELFDVPSALISLVDENRPWIKSCSGFATQQTSLIDIFCLEAIKSPGVLVVEDAALDERFANSPLVNGSPNIRFYAGAPLETRDGYRLGTLCIIDREPRSFSNEKRQRLKKFAAVVMDEFELRRDAEAGQRAERRYRLQLRVQEQVTSGVPLKSILSDLVEALERRRPGTRASILMYDQQDGVVKIGAAPSLPQEYHKAVAGQHPGPTIGPAGTALQKGVMVVSEDIAADPRWENFCALALNHSLGACWSAPIYGGDRLNGAVTIYFDEPGAQALDEGVIDEARILAGLAIEHHRDVTKERDREKALMSAKEEAEEAAKLKSTLLTNLSHEIRTPLTSILGFAEVLVDMDLDPEPEEFLRLICESGDRLLSTLDSVLDLSQIEAGTISLDLSPIELREVVQDTIKGFLPLAARADVRLVAELPQQPIKAVLDKAAVQRILSNLLSNAIKFNVECGEVLVKLNAQDDTISLTVEDTGRGIDPQFFPELYKEFQQESAGLSRRFEGAGLGLTITRKLISLMNGEIHVESEKGAGTVFTVQLPRRVGEMRRRAVA